MAEQGSLDFERASPDRSAEVERGLEAALKISRGTDPDSREAAAAAFDEAEWLAIRYPDPKTQMRVHEASGDFHFARKAFRVSKGKYETALGSANLLSVTSDDGVADVERLKFKLSRISNAQNPDFKNLERAAQPSPSYERRNLAWASYQKEKESSGGRLAARGFGSEEDFRRRLDDAKSTPTDEEDEEVRW
jgi:hypothetical protein